MDSKLMRVLRRFWVIDEVCRWIEWQLPSGQRIATLARAYQYRMEAEADANKCGRDPNDRRAQHDRLL